MHQMATHTSSIASYHESPPSVAVSLETPAASTIVVITPNLVNKAAVCTISKKCQLEAVVTPPRPLTCSDNDFSCICSKTNSMGANQFFNSHCIFTECPDPEAKKVFMNRYTERCRAMAKELTNIPAEWIPFAPLPPTSLSSLLLGTSSITSHSRMSPALSTAISTTSPADRHISICGISTKCMKKNDDHSPMCSPDDLDCICKASNSFANNSQFDQQCVFDECATDIGLREFLSNMIYHCRKINKELLDIPARWTVYLTTSASTAQSTATSIATPQTQPFAQHTQLSDGTIAGISVSSLFALGAITTIILAWRRSKKKNRQLTAENAKLADAVHKKGFTKRVYDMMNNSRVTLGTDNPSTLVNSSNLAANPPRDHERRHYGDRLHVGDEYGWNRFRYVQGQEDEIQPATPRPDAPRWQGRMFYE